MKKRILMLMMSFTLAAGALAGLSACGGKGSGPARMRTEQDAEKDKEKEDDIPDAVTMPDNKDDNADEKKVGTGEYMLIYSSYTGDAFTVDSAGNKINEFKRDEIFPKFKDKGYNLDNAQIIGAVGKVMFVIYSYYDEAEGVSTTYLEALDTENIEAHVLWTKVGYGDDEYLTAYEVYDGALYYALSGGVKPCREIKVEVADGFTFKESEPGLEKAFDTIFSHGQTNSPDRVDSYGYNGCFTHMMDTAGYLISRDEAGRYYTVNKEGEETVLRNFPESYVNLLYADKDYIVFNQSTEMSGNSTYKYEIATSIYEKLPVVIETYDSFLASDDGKIYYFINESEEFGHAVRVVYSLDLKNNRCEPLYRQADVPGSGYGMRPGVDGFKILDGDIYCLTVIDEKLEYARVTYDGSAPTYSAIDCVFGKTNVLSMGNVEYFSKNYYCPHCGAVVQQVYLEHFILNSDVSPAADEINRELEDSYTNAIAMYDSANYDHGEDECEYHKEHPEYYCITEEFNIGQVSTILDKFLVVDTSGYWYGGGAHGMPLRSQVIFDIKTGEQLFLEDLYNGTEEDFKKLCAEKTVENYKEDSMPYFSDDAQLVYDQAYEYASITGSYVEFCEDAAYLVYAPYEMGPYASGFIEVKIPYDELLGSN